MNFGIGSAFSEGPGPGLGPLYKVCLVCNTDDTRARSSSEIQEKINRRKK